MPKDYEPQRILNSFEFKVIKIIVKQKYPFIDNLVLHPNISDLETYTSVFYVDVIINGDKFLSWCDGCEITTSAKIILRKHSKVSGLYLDRLFTVSDLQSANIEYDLRTIANDVRTNETIPKELWMTEKRKMRFMHYILNKDTITI